VGNHPEVARHLDFRDCLRLHPRAARSYADLKRGLAARFPHDIDGYVKGKDAVVKEMIHEAQSWRAGYTRKDPASRHGSEEMDKGADGEHG
jgi:GrpB-like predicted nucleotidyltransferase (UPF0157 family)